MAIKKLLSILVYISLSSLGLFLINFIDNTPPFPLTFFPNIDTNYDQPFNINALYKPLIIILIWCIHHSLFIREPIREFIKTKLNIHDTTQLTIYRLIASILLLTVIFTYNSYNNSIGGGVIWNIEHISSSHNSWFIRNFFFLVICLLLIYSLRELGRLELVRSDIIITESIYGFVRHPVQLCLLLLFWITPRMTLSRFIFVIIFTIYVFIGLYLEEKTLINKFGVAYVEYKRNFPALMPHRKIHFECDNNKQKPS